MPLASRSVAISERGHYNAEMQEVSLWKRLHKTTPWFTKGGSSLHPFCVQIEMAKRLENETPVETISVRVFAHRGDTTTGFPENSLSAFRRVIEAVGADGFECDVRMAADGTLVILHDPQVSRTAVSVIPALEHKYGLRSLNGTELATFRLKPLLREGIPTLEEVLACIQGQEKGPFYLEIKEGHPTCVEGMIEAVQRYGLQDKVIFLSFEAKTLALSKVLCPDIRTEIIAVNPLSSLLKTAECARADGIAIAVPTFRFLKGRLRAEIARAHRAGLWVNAGIVNSIRTLPWLLASGIDGVFTDRSALIRWSVREIARMGGEIG